MSRRSQPMIEEFDDDTDLPLPNRSLPNTGHRGALLQSIDSDSDSDDNEIDFSADMHGASQAALHPGPATPSQGGQFDLPSHPRGEDDGHPRVSDLTPYKKWTCIYPIYIDAKRPFGPGSRRVAREKALWWPLSKDIADAASRLGFGTLHEVQKCHPRDWENPGRVRVQWKKEGRLLNNSIKTKKQLLEAISFYIQSIKPELIPKPPFTTSQPAMSTGAAPTPAKVASTKSKQASSKSKSKTTKRERAIVHAHTPRLPQPPEPSPPLASRLSAYSPAIPSGVLVDTIKAGMSAAAADNAAAGPAAGGKGKRKVVRVRA